MTARSRRDRGAFYTPPALARQLVQAVIVRPWSVRLAARDTDLDALAVELEGTVVLDPACGDGSLLVAALEALREVAVALAAAGGPVVEIGSAQLRGFDVHEPALEAARRRLPEAVLTHADSLHADWPDADVVLANPPYISKNRLQRVIGVDGVQALRSRWPRVPGGSDYCVYFLWRIAEHLQRGGRAGFIGTTTITETVSRRGGLDRLVAEGVLTEAWPDLPWPGQVAVRVAMFAWVAGETTLQPRLHEPQGVREVSRIGAHLSDAPDVSRSPVLPQNRGLAGQGVTHGHSGFLLTRDEAEARVARDPSEAPFLRPLVTGEDVMARWPVTPPRWVVMLPRDASAVPPRLLQWVEERVRPDRERAAAEERARRAGGPGPTHHARFLARWWRLSWSRDDLLERLAQRPSYLAIPRISVRHTVVRLPSSVVPSDVLVAIPLDDDYSLGVLQSRVHAAWVEARCSTLGRARRYTTRTVFETFPWPPEPSPAAVSCVVEASARLQAVRATLARERGSLRAALQAPTPQLERAMTDLDVAVRAAYGWTETTPALVALQSLALSGGAGCPSPSVEPPGGAQHRT